MASSSHLNWLIVRDHNAFMLKQRNIPKPFSKVNIQLHNALLIQFPMMTFINQPRSLKFFEDPICYF